MTDGAIAGAEYRQLDASKIRFKRERSQDGEELCLITEDGTYHVDTITMAFPLSHRTSMVVVRDQDGEEIGIISNLSGLDEASSKIVSMEMEKSYFLPAILDVYDVAEHLGVATWKVETDRGARTFLVRQPRQNLRKIGRRRVVIRDVDGNRYEIKNIQSLPPRAQRKFEEFL